MRSHPSTFYGCLPAGHIGTTRSIGTCHHPGTSQRNSVNLAERQWAFLCFVWKSKVKKKISFACLVCGVTVPYNKFPVLRGRHQVSEGQSSVKAAEAMKIKHAQCQSWSWNCSIFDINCSADAFLKANWPFITPNVTMGTSWVTDMGSCQSH